MNLYWTGARCSDIRYAHSIFNGSITIYGNNLNGNISYCMSQSERRVNHNIFSSDSATFILDKEKAIIEQDPECRFMPYNPNYAFDAPQEIIDRTVCLNDKHIMETLDNKIAFRNFAEKYVSMIPCEIKSKTEILHDEALYSEILQNKTLVFQAPVASGGEGTVLVNRENFSQVSDLLADDEKYIITEYLEENIPVNVHCVIFENDFLLFPPSVQIINKVDNHLLYMGADYIAFDCINRERKDELTAQVSLICRTIINDMPSSNGCHYLGVIGFDAVITPDRVYIVEANNRFQGSSYALNKALWENGFPSLQELNLQAFGEIKRTILNDDIENLRVPYSYCVFTNELDGIHSALISDRSHLVPEVCEISLDGYIPGQCAEKSAYLFHLLFNCAIVSVAQNQFESRLHPALVAPTSSWYKDIRDCKDINKIKTSLINQGLFITPNAQKHLMWDCGLNLNERFNIDLCLYLESDIWVNCPTAIRFAKFSPFELKYEENIGLYLTYYDESICSCGCMHSVDMPIGVTKSGCRLNNIAFLATDRIRFQNSPSCIFNKNYKACRFCEVFGDDLSFTVEDILETIDCCFLDKTVRKQFRHVLIGGRSNAIGVEHDTIIRMCRRIKSYSPEMPIYLMILPPKDLYSINDYFNAGVTEFGFNLEVFDRSIAKKIMPGKGAIPIEQYFRAFERAVSLCGKRGAVRTAFVVGLEPIESLLTGIKQVSQMGVAPILSAFRPIPNTPMSTCIPLSSEMLFSITEKAQEIASTYNISLGPSCTACQNNTLNIME